MVELNVLRARPGGVHPHRLLRERGFRSWDRYQVWRHDKLAAATDRITIDSSYASSLPDGARETAPVFLERDEPLRLRIFVDQEIVRRQAVCGDAGLPGRGGLEAGSPAIANRCEGKKQWTCALYVHPG